MMIIKNHGPSRLSSGEEKLLAAIKAVVLLVVFQSQIEIYFPSPISVVTGVSDKLFIIFGLALVILSEAFRRKLYFPASSKLLLGALFVGVGSLVLNSSDRIVSGIIQIPLTFQGIMVFFIVCNMSVSSNFMDRLLRFIIASGVLVLCFAVIEIFLPDMFRNVFHGGLVHEEALFRGAYVSLQSTFGHPGIFAWFMAFCFCICLSYCLVDNKNKLYFILLFLFAVAVILSLRRKTIIACILTLLLASIVTSRSIYNKILKTIVISVVLLIGLFAFEDRMTYLFNDAIDKYNFSSHDYSGPRVALTNVSELIADEYFPLGSGFGTFGSWMSRIDYSDLYYKYGLNDYWGMSEEDPRFINDTYWPMIIAEFGWIGSVLLLFFWLDLLRRSHSLVNYVTDKKHKIFSLAAFLVFFELLIESLSSPALSRSPQIFMVMLLLGLVFSLVKYEKPVK